MEIEFEGPKFYSQGKLLSESNLKKVFDKVFCLFFEFSDERLSAKKGPSFGSKRDDNRQKIKDNNETHLIFSIAISAHTHAKNSLKKPMR